MLLPKQSPNHTHKNMSTFLWAKGWQASIMLYVWLLTLMLKIQSLQRRDIWRRQDSQQKPEQRQDLGHDNAAQCRPPSWIWQLWWWQWWRYSWVCAMHAYTVCYHCLCLLVCSCHLTQKLCMSPHVCFLSSMCMYYHIKLAGVKAFMCLYLPVACSHWG